MPGSFFDTNVLLCVVSGDPAKAERADRAGTRGAPRTVDSRRDDSRRNAGCRLRHSVVGRSAGWNHARSPAPYRKSVSCSVTRGRSEPVLNSRVVKNTRVTSGADLYFVRWIAVDYFTGQEIPGIVISESALGRERRRVNSGSSQASLPAAFYPVNGSRVTLPDSSISRTLLSITSTGLSPPSRKASAA